MTTQITYPLRHPTMQLIPIALGLAVWGMWDWPQGLLACFCWWGGWCLARADAGPDPMDGEPLR